MSDPDKKTFEDLLAERNELWAELQRRNAVEADLEYWRSRAEGIERSRWWRAGMPLRYAKRFVSDPAGMLEGRAAAIRRRRRGA